MLQLDLLGLLAGFMAYAISIGGSAVLVLLFFRVNLGLARAKNEATGKENLKSKRKEIARLLRRDRDPNDPPLSSAPSIALGTATLCQAILLRHGVFPAMSVVRDLFLSGISMASLWRGLVQCGFILVAIAAVSVLSIWLAGTIFTKMTGDLDEWAEIRAGNVPVAIFFAFILFSITLILNEGIEDLSSTLIPYGRSGVIRIP